jgi:hypothetical protein
MAYENALSQLQFGLSSFLGGLVESIAAFCIFAIIMIVGVFVADLLGKALRLFLEKIRIEKFLASHHVHDAFLGFAFSDILVSLLKLYVAVAFLAIAGEVVESSLVAFIAMQAIAYFPSLVQGLVVLLAGLIAGDYITDRMKQNKSIPFANTLAILVEVFIVYNALVIAMPMLLPASDPSLLIWSFLVLLAAFAFALGLGLAIAIGLGLKDTVAEIAKKNRGKFAKLL